MRIPTTLVLFVFLREAAAVYELIDDFSGTTFFENFDFYTGPDPTHGFVQYQPRDKARATGLIGFNNRTGDPFIGVDHKHVTPNGRPSVRITSRNSYNMSLIIGDFSHIPGTVCGSWPAFWTLGPNWPSGGEVDILEGVNLQMQNSMTLHTGPNCTIERHAPMTGQVSTTDCYIQAPGQSYGEGCSVKGSDPRGFGTKFNQVGGGVYALEWREDGMSIWFFPRSVIPLDIKLGKPDPRRWGLPTARYQGHCDFRRSFRDMQIIINTDFCGDWAEGVWQQGHCAELTPTCLEWVRDNPGEFEETYWDIRSIRVYRERSEDGPPYRLNGHGHGHGRRGHGYHAPALRARRDFHL